LRLVRHNMEDPFSNRMPLNRFRAIAFGLLCVIWLPLAAPLFGAGQADANLKSEYFTAKEDILKLEMAVNEVITSTFSGSFAVVNRPKGVYLPGYGVNLSFLVNIHRAVINTPFGQVRSKRAITPELKKQRIEEMKEKLVRVLQENGETFRLRTEESLSIVAFIEDRNFPDEPSENRTILLSVLKKDLDELKNRNDRAREFKQRIKIVEY